MSFENLTEIAVKDIEKKYEMIETRGRMYRIKALRDFGDVKKGDLGGFIQKEENLSHLSNCWIYDKAVVCDNAHICDNAKVKDSAYVTDSAIIGEDAIISGCAIIKDWALVRGYANVSDHACVRGKAQVNGKAIISNCACINENARITDNAIVKDRAYVGGQAIITGNAILKDSQNIEDYAVVTIDLSKNLKENIRCQTGLCPIGDYVIAYKEVNNDLTSNYDKNFKYEVGKWAEIDYENQLKMFWEQNNNYLDSVSSFEEMVEIDKIAPCSVGLHFSNATYWNSSMYCKNGAISKKASSTMLIARINLDDIITVQAGKIRCKRAYIMDSYKINY